jgi:hypothetical protein
MKLLYTVLLIALPSIIFAQSNYHVGYIIKNNGDTLKGFINGREWVQCPLLIDFKTNKNDSQTSKFDPHTIKGFQIYGMQTYVSYKGTISMDRTRFPDLPFDLDTSRKSDTIFLKRIVTGRYLTLFYHQDDVKTRFFIAKTNGQPVELKYYQYYSTDNQPSEKDTYKEQLKFFTSEFMPGNIMVNKQVDNARYNQSDLEALVSEINGETNIVKRKSYVRLFAGLGMISTKSQLNDDTHQIQTTTTESTITSVIIIPLKATSFSTTLSPKIDFGIDFFANPDVQQFVFRAELSFYLAKGNFQYAIYNQGSDTNVNSGYSFDQYSATLTPQILYNFYNKDNFKMYIDGGIGLNFSVYANNKIKGFDLNSYWANLPIQAGIILSKKIEFSVSYTGYASYSGDGGGFNLKNRSVGGGFKYLFGGK